MPRLYQFIMQTCSNRMFYQPFSCFSSSQLLLFHSHPNLSPFSLLRKRKQTLEKHGVLIVLAICTWKRGLLWNVVDMSSVTPLARTDFTSPSSYDLQPASLPGMGLCDRVPFFWVSFCLAWTCAGKASAGYHSLCETLCPSVMWFLENFLWKSPTTFGSYKFSSLAPRLHRSPSFEGRVW